MQHPDDIDDPPRSKDGSRRRSAQTWPAPRRQLSSGSDPEDFLDRVIHEVMSEPDELGPDSAFPDRPRDEAAGSEYVVPEGLGLDDLEHGAAVPSELLPSSESVARTIPAPPKDEPMLESVARTIPAPRAEAAPELPDGAVSQPVRDYADWDPPSTHSLVVHSVRRPPVEKVAAEQEHRERALELPPIDPIVAEAPPSAPRPAPVAEAEEEERPEEEEDEEEDVEPELPLRLRSRTPAPAPVDAHAHAHPHPEEEDGGRRGFATHLLAFVIGVTGAVLVTQALRQPADDGAVTAVTATARPPSTQSATPPVVATATESPTSASAPPTASVAPPPIGTTALAPSASATVESPPVTPPSWRPPPRETATPYQEPPPPPAPPPPKGDPYEEKKKPPPPADDGFYQ